MTAPALAERIAGVVRRAAGGKEGPIPLHEPCFAGSEWNFVRECLDSGWVSSVGSFVDRFERALEDFTGAPHAVAVVNGTAALHLCLLLAGVEPGDEVLIPALSFVATANAVAYCGAVPHFVDSEISTLGVDPVKLARYLEEIALPSPGGCRNRMSGRPIRALVPMHTFGHPADLQGLSELCGRFGLALVEDAAESLGSRYRGAHTGTFGLLGAVSFNGNKIVTTGGGGAILTGDEALARRARHLSTTAKLPHRWAFRHDAVGFNYRLPNLNAALGVAQMEELPAFLSAKRRLAAYYREEFATLAGASFFAAPEGCQSNYWLNALLLAPELAGLRDRLLDELNDRGIMARPAWEPLHRLPPYLDAPRMELSTAEGLADRIINIPSSPALGLALERSTPVNHGEQGEQP
ncbi:LegC family aminotransferase [Geomonas sp. Red32]|uniref:LegC family aminotransferase n=1 Tax=Geomonas sp. Red32 TaxID=2912856 RepID=UPI00202CC245|nr:LegC family aminotransferase [Geomonas sp. Red32]MCM0081189.1 LegC family aminotransferase [Geomonas sp. Red32]